MLSLSCGCLQSCYPALLGSILPCFADNNQQQMATIIIGVIEKYLGRVWFFKFKLSIRQLEWMLMIVWMFSIVLLLLMNCQTDWSWIVLETLQFEQLGQGKESRSAFCGIFLWIGLLVVHIFFCGCWKSLTTLQGSCRKLILNKIISYFFLVSYCLYLQFYSYLVLQIILPKLNNFY